jgi:hypothetical protein
MANDRLDKKSGKNKKKKYISPRIAALGTLSLAALNAQAGVTSSRMLKKDIRPLTDRDHARMLSKIRGLKLYRFRYITEKSSGKARLGVIAEEAPRELTDKARLTVDVGSALGFIMAGIKAQEERHRRLESEVTLQRRQIAAFLKKIRTS